MSSSPRLTWPSMSTMTMPCVPQCCGTFLQSQMSARHKAYLALCRRALLKKGSLGDCIDRDWNTQQAAAELPHGSYQQAAAGPRASAHVRING